MSLIKISSLNKEYLLGEVSVKALKNISFSVENGTFMSIMGHSGSGKSTLMNILGCLDTPTSGEYFLDTINVKDLTENELASIRNKKVGFVFQSFNLIPRLSAIENIELPLDYSGCKDSRERAFKALSNVGMEHRANHRPNELSGGERQRIAIARAIVNNPSVIFADEPTGNLDTKTGLNIMNLFSELNNNGVTIIIVTHEEEIANFTHRIIRLKDGELIEDKKC